MIADKEQPLWSIYSIRNIQTLKVYFGLALNVKERWKHHKLDAKHGRGYHLHNALRLYGIDAFEWKIEQTGLTLDQAKAEETSRILKARQEEGVYNVTDGGERPFTVMSAEGRKRISERNTGVPLTEEHRRAISRGNLGKKKSLEHIANHITALYASEKMQAAWQALNGVPHTPERKANITQGQRNRRAREKESPDYEKNKAVENAKRSATWARKREEKLKAKYVPVRLNLLPKDDTIPE